MDNLVIVLPVLGLIVAFAVCSTQASAAIPFLIATAFFDNIYFELQWLPPVRLYEILIILVIIKLVLTKSLRGTLPRVHIPHQFYMLGAYVALLGVSLAWVGADEAPIGIKYTAHQFVLLLFCLSMYNLLRRDVAHLGLGLRSILVVGVTATLIGAAQLVVSSFGFDSSGWYRHQTIPIAGERIGLSVFFGGMHRPGQVLPMGRPSSWFSEPDYFGAYLVWVVLIAMVFYLEGGRVQRESNPVMRIKGITVLLLVLMIAFLGVRSSWIGLIIGTLAYGRLARRLALSRGLKYLALAVYVFLAVLLIVLILRPDMITGYASRFSYDSPAETRMIQWRAVIIRFLNRPLLGNGIGSYVKVAWNLLPSLKNANVIHPTPLGIVFSLIHDIGIIGLVVFAWPLVSLWREARKASRASFTVEPLYCRATMSALLGVLGWGMFTNLLNMSLFWIALAFAAASVDICRRSHGPIDPGTMS